MAPKHDNAPPPPPPHSPEEAAARRAFNTPENATRAVAMARSCIRFLTAGRVWTKKNPHGQLELKGSLMLEKNAVLALHFNPEDGSVLPKGLHAMGEGKAEIKSKIEAVLQALPKEIEALDGAEFREPECCWAVPLAYRNRIVGHIKISADGSEVVPDKKAAD